ncbi:D-methionine transport system permease protein [Weissella oryzae SG25]|uniref:D-methionine transport system permease protein n=1 Tax=Weissella oryzae (strain DSM 25784 / JCM 18191 / LMG 30913 / SG25) TaxID=1329250 RepID=A0A069CRH5_WEIOS|nr:methionine ABC transporter permease [Weissella oryzae]GAK29957.1 D-methionine transport system permease protein [Weissella oryzae SG25]
MGHFIETYLPNVYALGWTGDMSWGQAIWETIYMTFGAGIIGGILGLIFGFGLVLSAEDGIKPNRSVYQIFDKVVSIGRAIPFIIMLAIVAPITQLLTGTIIGPTAALVPLTLGVFPFFARQVQVALLSVDPGKIEAAQAFGATDRDIIFDVYIREGRSELIRISTVTLISMVGLTAMAGAIGGGGLGTTAIATGYDRFQFDVMWVATIILLIFIIIIQLVGDLLAKRYSHK